MALIYNGTTLPPSANITYNGTKLSKIIYNGVTVWQSEFYVIQNGNVMKASSILSTNVSGGWSAHAGVNNTTNPIGTFSESVAYPDSNIYGTRIAGLYAGNDHNCGHTSWIKYTITFGSDVAGKSVTADFLAHYSARYFDGKCIIKNGGESGADIINTVLPNSNASDFIRNPIQKTFTLNSNGVLYFYGEFTCQNDAWCPSLRLGIINLKVNN
jgi:hypothetical protein